MKSSRIDRFPVSERRYNLPFVEYKYPKRNNTRSISMMIKLQNMIMP